MERVIKFAYSDDFGFFTEYFKIKTPSDISDDEVLEKFLKIHSKLSNSKEDKSYAEEINIITLVDTVKKETSWEITDIKPDIEVLLM